MRSRDRIACSVLDTVAVMTRDRFASSRPASPVSKRKWGKEGGPVGDAGWPREGVDLIALDRLREAAQLDPTASRIFPHTRFFGGLTKTRLPPCWRLPIRSAIAYRPRSWTTVLANAL